MKEQTPAKEGISFLYFIVNSWNAFTSMLVDLLVISYFYFLLRFQPNPLLIAAFGLGCTYLSFSMSFLYGFIEYLGIYLPVNLATKKYQKATRIIFRVSFVQLLVSCLSLFLVIFSYSILGFLGIHGELRDITSLYVKFNILERIIDSQATMMRNVVISMELSNHLNKISFLCLGAFVVLSSFGTFALGIFLPAYTIARLVKSSLEFYLILKLILEHYPEEGKKLPKMSQIMTNLKPMFLKSLQTSLSTYGEIMATEICTFFVASLNSIYSTGAWVIYQNMMIYMVLFAVGQC